MENPVMSGDTMLVSVAYLLKRYKKDSGYKKAKKTHGKDFAESDDFDKNAYICRSLNRISEEIAERSYEFPRSVNVHAAFHEVARFMFTPAGPEEEFFFEWLKPGYDEIINAADEDDAAQNTPTEDRIRIMKLILLVNPKAVLRVKMNPYD